MYGEQIKELGEMRVLILEDDKARQRAFKQSFIGDIVEIAETASEVIRLLSSNTWDELYLDHDLGEEQMQESGPGTGYEAAKWLRDNPDRAPRHVFIHSYNPVGARNMKEQIPYAVLVPGIWNVKSR